MKPSLIPAILDLAFDARKQGRIFNPMFVGAPGLGKTEIIQQYAKNKGLQSVTITAALMEPPDFRGFPSVQMVNGRQRLTFATPELWPDSGEGIIILEEVNRGTTAVMNAVMALTDSRRGFDNYKLPEGWIVCSAVNDENEMNEVNTMDTALKDRFEMYHIDYDKKSFVEYMKSENWDLSVVQFVETGTWSYKLPEDIGNDPGNKYTSPRTFSKLNTAIQAGLDGEIEHETYNSILGKNIGRAFYQFRKEDMPISYEELLNDTRKAIKKLESYSSPGNVKNSHISITIKNIVENERTAEYPKIDDELLAKVFLALPTDQAISLTTELQYLRNEDGLNRRLAQAYPKIREKLKGTLK